MYVIKEWSFIYGHLICAVMCNVGRDAAKNIILNNGYTNLHINVSETHVVISKIGLSWSLTPIT